MCKTDQNCKITWYSRHACRLSYWGFFFFFFPLGPVPVVLQGSIGVPGELWPLCNITTPTEPLPWSNLSGVCQVSHLSHHPLTWPPKTRPFAATGGEEKGTRLQTRQRVQPITEIHANLTNHMRFCFKNNKRNITMTMTNMTTLVQMRQCRPAARLSALSKPNLPDCQRLLVALREHSLYFYVNFIVNIMIHYVKCYCLVYFVVFNNHFNIRHFFCLKLPSLGRALFS